MPYLECVIAKPEARQYLIMIMDAVVPKILYPVEIDNPLMVKAVAALRALEISSKRQIIRGRTEKRDQQSWKK
jgi:hypothetical protein